MKLMRLMSLNSSRDLLVSMICQALQVYLVNKFYFENKIFFIFVNMLDLTKFYIYCYAVITKKAFYFTI